MQNVGLGILEEVEPAAYSFLDLLLDVLFYLLSACGFLTTFVVFVAATCTTTSCFSGISVRNDGALYDPTKPPSVVPICTVLILPLVFETVPNTSRPVSATKSTVVVFPSIVTLSLVPDTKVYVGCLALQSWLQSSSMFGWFLQLQTPKMSSRTPPFGQASLQSYLLTH